MRNRIEYVAKASCFCNYGVRDLGMESRREAKRQAKKARRKQNKLFVQESLND